MRAFKIAALSLLLVPGAAAAAGVSGLTGTFTGKTSQGRPVVIRLLDGKVTAPSRILWSAPCGSLALSGTARLSGLLNANGTFSPPPAHGVAGKDGTKVKLTTTARFKVTGRVARGTFTTAASAYSSSGALIRRCGANQVTFTAKRR